MKSGDTAIIVGRNADSSWWLVVHDQIRGWAISDPAYSQVVGDTSNVPLVATPPTPVSTLKSSSSSLPRGLRNGAVYAGAKGAVHYGSGSPALVGHASQL